MRTLVEKIKAEVNLAHLCEEHGLVLQKTGRDYKCKCPFHADSDPSFVIYSKSNKYHCYGTSCGEHGDVIDFVQKMESLSFQEAAAKLAARLGLELPSSGNFAECEADSRTMKIIDDAATFYNFLLKERLKANETEVKDFLARRGLEPSSVDRFMIGYAPPGNALITHLMNTKRYEKEELLRTRLIKETEQGELRCFFQNRIIFPFLRNNRAMYLIGRSIGQGLPKYLNLPVTDQIKKGVFNQTAITSPANDLFITEGVIDCVIAEQFGFSSIAPSGLGDKIDLSRMPQGKKVYIVYDNDENQAGQAGARRLASSLLNAPVEARIVTLPRKSGQTKVDLADFLTSEGKDAFQEAVRASLSLFDIKLEEAKDLWGPGRVSFIREEIIPLLSSGNIREMDVAMHMEIMKEKLGLKTDMLQALRKELTEARRRKISSEPADGSVEVKQEMSEEDRAQAMQYLRDSALVENIVRDIPTIGLVGEDINALALYLFSLTRKTDKPISAVVFGDSSAGKSHLVKSICSLIPDEDQMVLSSASSKSFEHATEEQLKHKLIVLQEIEGMEEVQATIRVLQSEGRLARFVATKNDTTGQIETVRKNLECPACVITTTTRDRVHPENSTRIFELYVNQTPEQTAQIHELAREKVTAEWLAKEKAVARIQALHKNIQRIISAANVVIPFAEHIDFPTDSVRSRRDFPRFLDLIKAVALLRQFQKTPKRTVDGVDYIEADIEDYRIAFDLGKRLFASTFSPVSDRAKDVLRVCLEIGAGQFTRADVKKKAREMRVHVPENGRSLAQQLRSLEEADAIECIEGRKGKSYTYAMKIEKLEDLEQAKVNVIPTPEQIAEQIRPGKEALQPCGLKSPSAESDSFIGAISAPKKPTSGIEV